MVQNKIQTLSKSNERRPQDYKFIESDHNFKQYQVPLEKSNQLFVDEGKSRPLSRGNQNGSYNPSRLQSRQREMKSRDNSRMQVLQH